LFQPEIKLHVFTPAPFTVRTIRFSPVPAFFTGFFPSVRILPWCRHPHGADVVPASDRSARPLINAI
jgi:hypothetical protein